MLNEGANKQPIPDREGFGAGPTGLPKTNPGPGIFDRVQDQDDSGSSENGNDSSAYPPPASHAQTQRESDNQNKSQGLAAFIQERLDANNDLARNPLRPDKWSTGQKEESGQENETDAEDTEDMEEEPTPKQRPRTQVPPTGNGTGTQPFTLKAAGQERTIQIPDSIDLSDPRVVKELQDAYSAKIGLEELKKSGGYDALKAMKEAALEGAKLGLEHSKSIADSQAKEQKGKKSYRDLLPPGLQQKFDEALQERDTGTVLMLEELAKARLENNFLKQKFDEFDQNFNQFTTNTESDRAMMRCLTKIKRFAPNLPGDPSDPIEFVKELVKPDTGYFAYLANTLNLHPDIYMAENFRHDKYLRLFAEDTGLSLENKDNGKPPRSKGKTSQPQQQSAGTQASVDKARQAREARDRIEGGAQGSHLSGDTDEERFYKYHDAPLPVRKEMERQYPNIDREYKKWYRGEELKGRVSPFGLGAKRGR